MLDHFAKILFDETVSVELPMSEYCNLRCSYCYITNNLYKKRHIKYDNLNKILNELPFMFPKFQSRDEQLSLIPWGAEPLCNWKVIEKVLREELIRNPNLKTTWSTNATFIPKGFIDFLKEFHNQIERLQVSLDGPEEVQNDTRKYVNGGGSFNDVMNFLDTVRNNVPDLVITFKATLSSQQIEKGFFYKSVKFFLTELKEDIASTSIVADKPYSNLAISQFKKDFDRLYNEWDDILSINPNAKLIMFTKLASLKDPHCSAGRNEVGIDLDGNIYPCHGPITGSDRLKSLFNLGNIFTKDVNEKGIYRWFYNKYNSKLLMSPLCSSCPVYQVNPAYCYVCPIETVNSTQSAWMVLPSVCEMRKVIVKEYNRWNNDRT